MPTETTRPVRNPATVQRRVVLVLGLTQIAGGTGMGAMLAVGALLALELSGSDTWSGMATTMITLGAAVFALPLASLATRSGRRPGLTTGWAVGALGGTVVLVATVLDTFVLFLVGMVLVGAGTATNLQARHAAADLASDRNRARDLSIVVWATTVGAVLGPNLVAPLAPLSRVLGLPELLGPVVATTVGFGVGAAMTFLLLRPDPLLLATRCRTADTPDIGKLTVPDALRVAANSPGALLAVVGIVAGHTVMVAVMTMTPVHMSQHGSELTVIGPTISLHIAGMYALAPVVGRLTDRLGRVPMLLTGHSVLVVAAAVSGSAGHDETWVTVGLVLLGLGWSFALVSGTALLAESLSAEVRPRVQGISDLVMNLGGAAAGGLSGLVLAQTGFAGLNLFAALFTLPVFALAVRALLARRRWGGGDPNSA